MSYANDPMDQVLEGMAVYDADGRRLGDVRDVGFGVFRAEVGGQTVVEERAYFRLKRDAGGDLYVPGAAIESVGPDGVTLEPSGDPAELERYAAAPDPQGPEEPGERDLTTTLV